MKKLTITLIVFSLFGFAASLSANVDKQMKLTQNLKTKNGIRVLYRSSNSSPIFRLSINFEKGLKDLKPKDRVAYTMMMSLMPYSTKSKSKEETDKIKEKYSLAIGCGSGLELASCGLTSTDDNWEKGLDLLADILINPEFNQKGFETRRARAKSRLEATPQDPSSYSNDVLNKIYYGPGHPYYSDYKEDLFHLKSLKTSDLRKLHSVLKSSNKMFITVVSSLPAKTVMKKLDSLFGKIQKFPSISKKVVEPVFNPKNTVAFEHRDIPTAYIRFKFNLPDYTSADKTKIKLMLKVLSEELMNEVRNKRSLSYSVHSYGIENSIGVGVISVSTSKPEETIKVIQMVVDSIKNKKLSKSVLDEYKPVFKTRFYQRLESQGAFESSLSREYFYFKSTKPFYEFPDKINQITPDDIHQVANKYLKNMRVAAIFHKDKFKKKWTLDFVRHFAENKYKKLIR